MKVAAVATMCQDERVFQAMMDAGTPCPFAGKIGEAAKQEWDNNPQRKHGSLKAVNEKDTSGSSGNWFTNLFRPSATDDK